MESHESSQTLVKLSFVGIFLPISFDDLSMKRLSVSSMMQTDTTVWLMRALSTNLPRTIRFSYHNFLITKKVFLFMQKVS